MALESKITAALFA